MKNILSKHDEKDLKSNEQCVMSLTNDLLFGNLFDQDICGAHISVSSLYVEKKLYPKCNALKLQALESFVSCDNSFTKLATQGLKQGNPDLCWEYFQKYVYKIIC